MPYVKYIGPDEREVPDLRLIVNTGTTYEVPQDQLAGLLCQSVWEKASPTKSADKADPPEPDEDLTAKEASK